MWGPSSQINDYASKQWNGLMGKYYIVRWKSFFEEIIKNFSEGKDFDENEFDKNVEMFEIKWNYEMEDEYQRKPKGDSHEFAKYFYGKYEKLFQDNCKKKF